MSIRTNNSILFRHVAEARYNLKTLRELHRTSGAKNEALSAMYGRYMTILTSYIKQFEEDYDYTWISPETRKLVQEFIEELRTEYNKMRLKIKKKFNITVKELDKPKTRLGILIFAD